MYHGSSKRKEDKKTALLDINHDNLGSTIQAHVEHIIPHLLKIYNSMINHIIENKDKLLKKDAQESSELSETSKNMKGNIHATFLSLPDQALQNGEKYVQAVDYLRKCCTTLENITHQSRDYALNQHPDLIESQQHELADVEKTLKKLLESTLHCFRS